MDHDDTATAVRTAVAEALGEDMGDVTDDATLLGELGAESIDLLDMLFRIERSLGVKIQAADLAEYVQGGIPDDAFGDEQEVITPLGLAHLATVMPQIDVGALRGRLRADEVMGLFTVGNLVEMVADRAARVG